MLHEMECLTIRMMVCDIVMILTVVRNTFLEVKCLNIKHTPAINTLCQYAANGPLARYVKLRVAHASGMPGTFSLPPELSNPDMHHDTCVTHVPRCMPGSLTSGFFWSRWRGKRSRHSGRMRNPHFYVSSKRPMPWTVPMVHILLCYGSDQFYPYLSRLLYWQWGTGSLKQIKIAQQNRAPQNMCLFYGLRCNHPKSLIIF